MLIKPKIDNKISNSKDFDEVMNSQGVHLGKRIISENKDVLENTCINTIGDLHTEMKNKMTNKWVKDNTSNGSINLNRFKIWSRLFGKKSGSLQKEFDFYGSL